MNITKEKEEIAKKIIKRTKFKPQFRNKAIFLKQLTENTFYCYSIQRHKHKWEPKWLCMRIIDNIVKYGVICHGSNLVGDFMHSDATTRLEISELFLTRKENISRQVHRFAASLKNKVKIPALLSTQKSYGAA